MASATYYQERVKPLEGYQESFTYVDVVGVEASHGETSVLGAVDVPLAAQDFDVLCLHSHVNNAPDELTRPVDLQASEGKHSDLAGDVRPVLVNGSRSGAIDLCTDTSAGWREQAGSLVEPP